MSAVGGKMQRQNSRPDPTARSRACPHDERSWQPPAPRPRPRRFATTRSTRSSRRDAPRAARRPTRSRRTRTSGARSSRRFTVDRSLVNLNNGGVCPSPRVVQEAMKRYLDFSNEAPVYTMWQLLEPQIESVRRGLARAFGCDPEEIAITRNASEALEIVQLGPRPEAGRRGPHHQPGLPAHAHHLAPARAARRHRAQDRSRSRCRPRASTSSCERFERAITPRTKRDPGLPHHQPHRPDLPGAARSAGWRARAGSR